MSSPAHIVDPGEGPAYKLPGSLPPGWEPVRAFGLEHEYAETQHNPPPEVVCCGPEGGAQNVPAASQVGGGDGANGGGSEHDTRSSIRPDIEGNKEHGFHDTPDIEPPELPWYRTISRGRWAAIVICLVGSTAVVLAILGAMNRLSGNNSTSSDSSHSDDETATTATASSSTSTTTAAKPTSTTNPAATMIDCTNSSTFVSPVTWIGAELGYTTHFSPDSDAESCCNSCLHHDPGCAGWLYDNTTKFTPCTKIVINTKHAGQDDDDETETCPQGYTDKTYFTEGTNGKGSVAGLGPCSRMIKMQ